MAPLLLSAAAGGSAMAMPATSLKSCADEVISDWYDDGRVGKIYPLECYRQAIKQLPTDVLDYSNAKEEIGRALAFAKQGKPDPGGADPTPATTTQTTGTSSSLTDSTASNTSETSDTSDTSDTSGPSSVPVPLLVLGGLAVLLLAAGGAGYLRRRLNGDDEGDGTPPAAA